MLVGSTGMAAGAADSHLEQLVSQGATCFQKSNLSFFLQLVGKCTFSKGLLMFCCVTYCGMSKIIPYTCIVPSV